MSFDETQWWTDTHQQLVRFAQDPQSALAQAGTTSTYHFLLGSTLIPVITAMRLDYSSAITICSRIVGEKGKKLIENLVSQRYPAEQALILAVSEVQNPELFLAYKQIAQRLRIIPRAKSILIQNNQTTIIEKLEAEIAHIEHQDSPNSDKPHFNQNKTNTENFQSETSIRHRNSTKIDQYIRRLRLLEIEQMRFGYDTKPDIIMEIEDLRLKLAQLSKLNNEVDAQSEDVIEPPVDFIIITALEEERNAVIQKLTGVKRQNPSIHDIQVYYTCFLPVHFPDGTQGIYSLVIMSLVHMGRVYAASATNDAIRKWKPRNILMVGIAGGVSEASVQIGDVLIADQIVDYELQKITEKGPEVRWQVHRTDPRLLNAVHNLSEQSWRDHIHIQRTDTNQSKRIIGPIASGDKVIAYNQLLKRYRKVWPKLIGVEMEAGGAAAAAFQAADSPGFFMVRGVSDLADEQKGTPSVEAWRTYACDAAAAYAIALLKSGPIPPQREGQGGGAPL